MSQYSLIDCAQSSKLVQQNSNSYQPRGLCNRLKRFHNQRVITSQFIFKYYVFGHFSQEIIALDQKELKDPNNPTCTLYRPAR